MLADSLKKLLAKDSSSISPNNLMKLGKVVGKIEGNDVVMLSKGNQTIYILNVDNQATAFVGFEGENLKNIKNFTQAPGVIRALIGYLVHKKNMKIAISPNEPLTSSGLNWIIKLINDPRGLIIKDHNGKDIDTIQLKQEWQTAKRTGMPGTTGIIISESIYFGNKLRENESKRNNNSLLMPFNFYSIKNKKQGVAEDKVVSLMISSGSVPQFKQKIFETALDYHRFLMRPKEGVDRLHNCRRHPLTHYAALLEDNETSNQARQFADIVMSLDQRKTTKIAEGSNLSLIHTMILPGNKLIDIYGFINPKTIEKIYHANDGSIDHILFDDGSTYPESGELVNVGGINITNTIMFSDESSARQAYTKLWFAVNNMEGKGWKVKTDLSETVDEQAPMFTPEDKMVNANNPTGTGWRFYKTKSAGTKESAIMKGIQR